MATTVSTAARIATAWVGLCLLASWATGTLDSWKAGWLDLQFQIREALRNETQRSRLHSDDIVLVAIDEESAQDWPALSPIPRDHLARVVQQLKEAGARTILLDVTFDTPRPHDDLLAHAIHQAGNVVIGYRLDPLTIGREVIRPPQRKFLQAAAAAGLAHLEVEQGSFVRRVIPRKFVRGNVPAEMKDVQDGQHVFLGITAVAHFLGQAPHDIARAYERRWSTGWSLGSSDRSVLIDFISPHSLTSSDTTMGWRAFPSIYVTQISEVTNQGLLNPYFKDKLVLVGSTLIDVPDRFQVPLSRHWLTRSPRAWAGLEIIAQVANMQLIARGLRSPPLPLFVVLVWLACFGISYLTLGRTPASGALAALGLTAAAVAGSLLLFCRAGWVVDVVVPVVAIATTFGFSAYRHRSEEAHRKALEAELAEADRRRLAGLAEAREAVMKTIVHDLKVPITIIKGEALTLLQDSEGALGEEIRHEFLEAMAQQCDRLGNDIDDLLDIDPNRKIALKLAPVDLCALVTDVINSQKVYAHHHEIRMEVANDLPPLHLDKAKIIRVLTNLINNAIKYSPEGGDVLVSLTRQDGQVEVSVRDQGIGMTPEQRGRLFQLFERVVEARHNIPGTGVGLFSTKRLIEAHGGTIEVESQPDQGSRFFFRIPMSPAS